MADSELEDVLARADEYWRYVLYTTNGYYMAASHAGRNYALLGGSAIAIGAIVSTSIFASITQEPGVAFAIATGLLVVLAAVLSALQTFFGTRLNDDVEANRNAGASFAPFIRELELFWLARAKQSDRAAAIADLHAISDRIAEVEAKSPALANRFYDRAVKVRKQRDGSGPTLQDHSKPPPSRLAR